MMNIGVLTRGSVSDLPGPRETGFMREHMITAVVGGTIAAVLGGVILAWMGFSDGGSSPKQHSPSAAPTAVPVNPHPTPTVFFQHQDGLAFCRQRGYAIYHYSRHKEGGGVIHHCDMAPGAKSKGQLRCEQDYPNSTFLRWQDEARGIALCRQ